MSAVCEHLASAPGDTQPQTPACAECTAEGIEWAQVRMCLTCGHVGCCDSGPGKHATAHFKATGHPVMRTIVPGQNWRWCYVDEAMG
jgi:CPA1 family monovalent cation:H+ antiporter